MAANKQIGFGPVIMSTVITNIINPPTLTGGTGLTGTNTSTYLIIRHITIVNRFTFAVNFSLYLGGSGGAVNGTEIIGTATAIPANSNYTFYCNIRMDSTQYLTGLASSATALSFQADGEIGVA